MGLALQIRVRASRENDKREATGLKEKRTYESTYINWQ